MDPGLGADSRRRDRSSTRAATWEQQSKHQHLHETSGRCVVALSGFLPSYHRGCVWGAATLVLSSLAHHCLILATKGENTVKTCGGPPLPREMKWHFAGGPCRALLSNRALSPLRQTYYSTHPKRLAMQYTVHVLDRPTFLHSTPHCSLSSPSSTVTLLRVAACPSELLAPTAELDPSASALSPTLPKLQLDSRLLGSAAFGEE